MSRLRGCAQRLEHSGDLDGVVPVIVDNGDAVPLAGPGEAALDAAEARIPADRLADTRLARHRNRGRRVQGVVRRASH